MSKILTKKDMYEILVNYTTIPQNVIDSIIKINGDREQVYKDILFAFTDVANFNIFIEEHIQEEEIE